MPYNRSLPAETLARIETEIALALPGADATVRYSVERVLARMLAMASHELEGYIEYVHRQILPTTCDVETLPLHGFLWSTPRRLASVAGGDVTFTGANGNTVTAGTVLRRPGDIEYTLDTDVTISAGTATGHVTAIVAGVASNAPMASTLTLSSPVGGVQSIVTAPDGITGGVNLEDAETWRARIIERWRTPPHGGNAADYQLWAKAVAGVTRVWVYPNQLGRGSVYLLFVMDEKTGSIIPSLDEIETLQEYLDIKRPVTADVTVAAPVPVEVDFTVNISPNSVAVQNAIEEELKDLIRRESIPGGTLLISHIREAISVAAGEADHVLVSPSANVVRSFGQISVLGDITFGAIV